MRRAITVLLALAALAFAGAASVSADQPEMVTICHAAGLADEPANYVTLTLPWVAVYGQAGHFNENGTTQAGHEQDYLGTCIEESPSASPSESESASPSPTPSYVACPGIEIQIPEATSCPSESASPSPTSSIGTAETATPTPKDPSRHDVPNTAMDAPSVMSGLLFIFGMLFIAAAFAAAGSMAYQRIRRR